MGIFIIKVLNYFACLYEKHFSAEKDHCDECDKDYYICEVCGCEFDDARSAAVCRDWDRILRNFNKEHKHHNYPHDHLND